MQNTPTSDKDSFYSVRKRVHPAPGVHILAAGCTVLKCVHKAGAPFFFPNLRIDTSGAPPH